MGDSARVKQNGNMCVKQCLLHSVDKVCYRSLEGKTQYPVEVLDVAKGSHLQVTHSHSDRIAAVATLLLGLASSGLGFPLPGPGLSSLVY